MPRYTWHKQKCTGCPSLHRYRGKEILGRITGHCIRCLAPVRVIEIRWGPEKYAQGRDGQVDKL